MIAPLRAWHRRFWLVLAIVLPLLILLAISVRQPVPPVEHLPGAAAAEVEP